jgi:hypothetical protein
LLNQSRTRQAAGWRTTAAAAAATRRLAFQLDVARSFSNSLASVAGTTVFLFPCLVQLQASTRVADRGHDSRDSKRDSPLPPPAAPLPFGLGPRRSLPSGVRRPPVASGCLDSLCTRSRRSGQLPAWARPPVLAPAVPGSSHRPQRCASGAQLQQVPVRAHAPCTLFIFPCVTIQLFHEVSLRLEIAPIQTDVKINSLTLLAVHPGVARQVFCFSFLAFGKHSTLSVHKKNGWY